MYRLHVWISTDWLLAFTSYFNSTRSGRLLKLTLASTENLRPRVINLITRDYAQHELVVSLTQLYRLCKFEVQA